MDAALRYLGFYGEHSEEPRPWDGTSWGGRIRILATAIIAGLLVFLLTFLTIGKLGGYFQLTPLALSIFTVVITMNFQRRHMNTPDAEGDFDGTQD